MRNIEIEYSIISPGTERHKESLGYMAITKPINNNRFLLPIPHGVKTFDNLNHALTCKNYSIENIAISRFQLISALNFSRLLMHKNDKILICGLGMVGFGALLELIRLKINKISILTQKKNIPKFIFQLNNRIEILRKTNFMNYKYIIDTTGDGRFLNLIIFNANIGSHIVILGTPRIFNRIDALLIHRKNLTIYGFHEIAGFSDEIRNKFFKILLKDNLRYSTNEIGTMIKYYPFFSNDMKKYLKKNSQSLVIHILKL